MQSLQTFKACPLRIYLLNNSKRFLNTLKEYAHTLLSFNKFQLFTQLMTK